MEHRVRQLAASNGQLAEIRRQKSGVKLISDLRLLTSMIDDSYNIYDFYDLNGFYGFNDLLFTVHCFLKCFPL